MWIHVKIIFALLLVILDTRSETVWLNLFLKDINEHLNHYQVMIVLNDKNEIIENIANYITQKIRYPTLLFDQKNDNVNLLMNLSTFENSRKTTLFIFLSADVDSQFSKLQNTIDFVIQISKTRTRPECLSIILNENKSMSYENLLRYMWSKLFLDYTVLEIVHAYQKINFSTTLLSKLLFQGESKIAFVHSFNPFKNDYKKLEYLSTTELFPYKLGNLHGYILKAAVVNHTPTSGVKRNRTGHAEHIWGSDVKIIKAFAKSMNFTLVFPPSYDDHFGTVKCGSNSRFKGFQYDITNNKIQLFTVHGSMLDVCTPHRLESTRSTGIVSFCALIPILPAQTYSYFTKTKIYSMLVTFFLLGFILVLARLLHFNPEIWNAMNMFQLVIGSNVSQEPQKLPERILFGTLITIFIFFTSVIYSVLMDIILKEESTLKIETFEDLYKSGLLFMIHEFRYNELMKSNEPVAKKLLKHAVLNDDYFTEISCRNMLLKYKNVSCIMLDNIAAIYVEKSKDKLGRPAMKIMKENLAETLVSIPLEPNSPYTKRFDGILIKLDEAGLILKWREYHRSKKKIIENPVGNSPDSQDLRRRLHNIIIVGYVLSTISFIGELLVSKLRFEHKLGNYS